jgi:aspartate carbamoyltransferase
MSKLLQPKHLHLLSVASLSLSDIKNYILHAEYFKGTKPHQLCSQRTLINLFYEPSTRTSCSFQAAMLKLGGSVITVNEQFSSAQKGESLEDTIKTVGHYGDVIVLRHPQKGAAQIAATVSSVPVINAGDGNGEHPSQALLDIFTIKTELQSHGMNLYSENREPVVVTFVGDLKNSRTIHSLVRVLAHFPKIRLCYVCPTGLEIPTELAAELAEKDVVQISADSLQDALPTTDVLYVTRIQKERFASPADYQAIMQSSDRKKYVVDNDLLIHSNAKKTLIIMHPLPRLDEIHVEVDSDSRAAYFRQVDNGIYMRMSILYFFFMNMRP